MGGVSLAQTSAAGQNGRLRGEGRRGSAITVGTMGQRACHAMGGPLAPPRLPASPPMGSRRWRSFRGTLHFETPEIESLQNGALVGAGRRFEQRFRRKADRWRRRTGYADVKAPKHLIRACSAARSWRAWWMASWGARLAASLTPPAIIGKRAADFSRRGLKSAPR